MDVMEVKQSAISLVGRLSFRWDAEPIVARITRSSAVNSDEHIYFTKHGEPRPDGFADYVLSGVAQNEVELAPHVIPLPPEIDYLEEGDVVRINPRAGEIWVMYRRSSPHNSVLLTERCNSYCVMCSQPPRPHADDWLAQAWLEAIPLMDVATGELGISGGEPTLLKDDFLDLITTCAHCLPNTSLHVLTNGRLFNYLAFAERLRDLAHPDLVLGVPLYSDIAWEHDFVVQAEQAFDQTIRGLLNLARCQIRIELRLVIHRYTATTLKSFARFVARNLPFVEHVALMGLEPIGFARSNLAALWIDPADYREELTGAVKHFVEHGMAVSIYNHQLCTLPPDLWTFARRSISDWKNIYLPQCGSCEVRGECGGFFHSSAHVYSRSVSPITSPNLSPGV